MNMQSLSIYDLAFASALIFLLAGLSILLQLGLAKSVLIAAIRTALQLTLVGFVLETVFGAAPYWMLVMAFVMLSLAGWEVMRRQQRKFRGYWGYGIGTISMMVSSFSLSIFALVAVIRADPWYTPQYAIPLLGMLLGNTMNGISLGLERLTGSAWDQRAVIETQLALGYPARIVIRPQIRIAIRTSLIPIINSMSIAGLVSLPGMMTGQILSGTPPAEAVKYQIMIMFLIAGGTGLGSFAAVLAASYRLFDHRQRLRLDRLSVKR
jgi:putative ABC transport system permease protein